MRHLVCVPYTIENLHKMAKALGIKRCWYHASARHKHYDIPKTRIAEIQAKCTVVSPSEILAIIKGSGSTEDGELTLADVTPRGE